MIRSSVSSRTPMRWPERGRDGIDIRQWLPGEDWDSDAFAYRTPAKIYTASGNAKLPQDFTPGEYILAIGKPDPRKELINPWRYWALTARSDTIEKQVSDDGPEQGPAGKRVITALTAVDDASNHI